MNSTVKILSKVEGWGNTTVGCSWSVNESVTKQKVKPSTFIFESCVDSLSKLPPRKMRVAQFHFAPKIASHSSPTPSPLPCPKSAYAIDITTFSGIDRFPFSFSYGGSATLKSNQLPDIYYMLMSSIIDQFLLTLWIVT